MKKFSIALLAMAAALAMPPAGMANTVEINWVQNGTNELNGSITWPSANQSASSWTQVGSPTFNLAITGLSWNPNQGEAGNQTGGTGKSPTNPPPEPSIDSSSAGDTGTITVIDGGAFFQFDSSDVKNDLSSGADGETYTIVGYDGSTPEFTLTCGGAGNPACPSGNSYSTIDGCSDWINDPVISETAASGSYAFVDYLDLTPAPEPASLLLLGTGMLGLAFLAFRKAKASSLALRT